jgi:hypothetical protein
VPERDEIAERPRPSRSIAWRGAICAICAARLSSTSGCSGHGGPGRLRPSRPTDGAAAPGGLLLRTVIERFGLRADKRLASTSCSIRTCCGDRGV